MNNEILKELSKPFHPTQITWKPGTVKKDGTGALALAYGDLRAYQNRLDELLGPNWSVTYTPWGDKVVCHITIAGVTRSSTGEPDAQSERSEIGGTSAEAQAFKRACAMFGLGRYLYEFPSVWVEYDSGSKQFTDKAKAKLEGIVVAHYRRAMADVPPVIDKAIAGQEPPLSQNADESAPSGEPNPFHDNTIGVKAEKDTAMTAMVEKASHWRKLDGDSESACSDAQYSFLVMTVEAITGKGTHTDAFRRMFKREVNSENRPGKKAVSWLLDVLPEKVAQRGDDNKPVKDANGKNVYIANEKRDMVAVNTVKYLFEHSAPATGK